MTSSTSAFHLPAVRRSVAVLGTALLLAAGTQQAGAAPTASGSSGSSESSAATASTTATATSTGSASATSSTSSSSSQAPTSSTASSSPASACPDQVRITLGKISVAGGLVIISFSQNAHNCPSARPALLHIHQNLLMTPRAGSDPVHQRNTDFSIGFNHAGTVTVALLESADGKCFVQVDAHASGTARGQFFPTTTCSSATPSSPAPSSSESTSSPPPSSTAQTSTPPAPSTSQSFLSASTSRPAGQSLVPVAQHDGSPPTGSLASTGTGLAAPLGLAAALLLAGGWLVAWGRRPRRH